MNREKIEQLALVVVGSMTVLAAAFYLMLKPQWQRLMTVRAESGDVAAKLADAQSKVANLPNLKQSTKKMEARVAALEHDLVGNGSFDAFVTVIKHAADRAGIDLKTVRQRDDKLSVPRGAYHAERWVTVETVAPYHALGKWMSTLESQSPFVRIVAIRARAAPDCSGAHEAEITVSFLVKRVLP